MIQNFQITKRSIVIGTLVLMSAVAMQLTGCSTPMPNRAPVIDRSSGNQGTPSKSTSDVLVAPAFAPIPIDSKPLPNLMNAQHAGKSGYYTVKPGDTVMQIGRNTNQNWRDIVKWNNLESANQIEVGQVLRIAPLDANTSVTKPLAPSSTSAPVISTPLPSATQPIAAEEDIVLIWPSAGVVIAGFDEIKNKGINIAGKLGDPVYAAEDGIVVHASAVRGYGNLVIVKHNDTYLTAYAHNQTLLVKEDQSVRKGQRIAEMGKTDSDRVMLHFEFRRKGKPVDPAKYLPPR
jgi:lipoprotein NlpD